MAAKVFNLGGDYLNHERCAATNRLKDVDNTTTPVARTERPETGTEEESYSAEAALGASEATREESGQEAKEKKASKRKKRTSVEG